MADLEIIIMDFIPGFDVNYLEFIGRWQECMFVTALLKLNNFMRFDSNNMAIIRHEMCNTKSVHSLVQLKDC